MKKNKLLIILITILFLPFSINAVVRNNYDITKENTNLYINDFSRNNIYIIKIIWYIIDVIPNQSFLKLGTNQYYQCWLVFLFQEEINIMITWCWQTNNKVLKYK